MWKLGVNLILCLLFIGLTAGKESIDVTEDQEGPGYAALLDFVDQSQLDDLGVPVEDVIPSDDLFGDDNREDAIDDVGDLPAIDVIDDDDDDDDDFEDDDDDDDVTDVKNKWKGRRWERKRDQQKKRRWKGRHQKDEDRKGHQKKFWQRNKMERSEEKEEDRTASRMEAMNVMPMKRFVSKLAKIVDRKLDKPIRPRIFMRESDFEREEEKDDDEILAEDEDEEVEALYDAFPHPHGGKRHHRGHHKGHHHGKKHHGGKHHGGKHHGGRRPHWRPHHGRRHHNKHPRFHAMSLESRVEWICMKMDMGRVSNFHERLVAHLQEMVGNVERKSYRLEYIGKMRLCCNDTAQRVDCYVALNKERYDNFCDRRLPLKPWGPASPRHQTRAQTLNKTCCHLTEEERYDCFNKTMELMLEGSVEELMPEPISEDPLDEEDDEDDEDEDDEDGEEEDEDEDDDEEDDEEDEEEEDDAIVGNRDEFPGRRGRRRHKHHKGHGKHFAGPVKRECCQEGRETGSKIHKTGMRKQCYASAAKFAKQRKVMKKACGVSFSRCCIHAANRPSEGRPEVDHVNVEEPMPKYYDFTDEDDVIDEDDAMKAPVPEAPVHYRGADDIYTWKKKGRDGKKDVALDKNAGLYDKMID